MQQMAPNKTLIAAPTAGEGATCKSCANCPWMAMNGLQALKEALISPIGKEVFVEPGLAQRAMVPLNRMLNFAAELKVQIKGNA